ncbi:transcriptional regulator, IclR family [Thiothrix eikelboomii]|uniref:Transcriptional regulator, IclR family n=1 Tax=Thiothrix eikelboomii TaxID=92487 RepID=A0A1T4W2Q4_9GAMM|nr:IclR family transcriptional regulator [Thiothrix eikelboomii]SKA71532.1 transcriptional regulator, IclR family [Thiothrix eikelboomii]
MSSALEKALAVLEFMVRRPLGCPVSEIASALDMPVSGVHRLLKELERSGYVHQAHSMGEYTLTIKLASLGLSFLGQTGFCDLSQPILDDLAQTSQELVRLALADGDHLIWVGVAQGATSGLRYDPGSEQGQIAHLASSAGGQAWLAAMSDEEAIALVMQQGLHKTQPAGEAAPQSIAELLSILATIRERGYSMNSNSFLAGMAAMATVIYQADTQQAIGTVSIAGPSARLTPTVMQDMATALKQAALALGEASRASLYFSQHRPKPALRKLA